jgi:Tol biopolymer transport system component
MDPLSVQTRLTIEPEVRADIYWEENTLVFQPLEPWERGVEVVVRLEPGSRSSLFLPILSRWEWSFQVTEPRVLYLWPTGSPAQLYSRTLDKSSTVQISESEFGVLDYTLSLNGSILVYSAAREDFGTDLRAIDLSTGEDRLLFACPEAVSCTAPSISPDMKTLAFERRSMRVESGGQQVPDPAHVWLLTLQGEITPRLIGPVDHETQFPQWSLSGMLAIYDKTSQRILFLDPELDFNEIASVENQLGVMGSWSLEGDVFVFPEILFLEDVGFEDLDGEEVGFYSHLFRFILPTGEIDDLSRKNAILVEDASPVFSPDGRWIAFGRKFLDERWSLGRQLWLMRADGGGARSLTMDPDFAHSAIVWSQDSSSLLYLRIHQADLSDPSEIWFLAIDSGEPEMLVSGGYMPIWSP